jgi:hypothetical protein
MAEEEIKRLYYYNGQYLGYKDFLDEQKYNVEMRRRHNVAHHTWGIVVGLELDEREKEDQDAGVDIYIQPGMAIDAFGREILVLYPHKLDPLLFDAFTDIQFLEVWIGYQEKSVGQPRPGYELCDVPYQFQRVRESYRVFVGPRPADDPLMVAGREVKQSSDPGNLIIPADMSIPYQEYPEEERIQRWLIKLGCVKWDGVNRKFLKAESQRLREGRRYVGTISSQVLVPAGKLRIKDRLGESKNGVATILEGSLRVTGNDPDLSLDINSDSPNSWAELRFKMDNQLKSKIFWSKTNSRLYFENKGTRALVIDGGNVGIGTSDPKQNLSIKATRPRLVLTDKQGDAGVLEFHEGEKELRIQYWKDFGASWKKTMMTIETDSGNVGIGTTKPRQNLSIKATRPRLVLTDKHGDAGILEFHEGDKELRIQHWTDFGGTYKKTMMVIETDSGHVGIGTTRPRQNLSIMDTRPRLVLTDEHGDAGVLEFHEGEKEIRIQHWTDFGSHYNKTMMVLETNSGHVGIGTFGPSTRLHVADNKTGVASPQNHVVYIQNTGGSNADVLCLRVNKSIPASDNNFITFYGSGAQTLGSIQGNGSGSVALVGAGHDYAEWLPRLVPGELIEVGDIVGVREGKITRVTERADQVMAVSNGPIILGNMPDKQKEHLFEKVAFVGQVSLKVRGLVKAGDYIVPSGLNDGIGVAVSPQKITPTSYAQTVGRAWESSDEKKVKTIRTAVGLHSSYPDAKMISLLQDQQEEIRALRSEIQELKSDKGVRSIASTEG